MQQQNTKIGEGGRLVIPAAYRKALDLHPGDELIIRIENGELRLFRQSQALERIRAAVRKKLTRKVSHVDEFLEERKRDSE
jgi:AbrB family looped-hinge helix DNA binding protein